MKKVYFQLKKSQNMDEHPNFTLAETYDKIAMRKTFLSEGKHHGPLVDNLSFAAHRDCATFALCASLRYQWAYLTGCHVLYRSSEKRFF